MLDCNMDRLSGERNAAMFNEAEKKNLKIGFKEVMNLISQGCAVRVVVAQDCEDKIKVPVSQAAESAGIKTEYAQTMHELGKACAIDVGASCAAVVKF